MSKIMEWKYSDFFQSRREKVIKLLLSEIMFLKSKATKNQDS